MLRVVPIHVGVSDFGQMPTHLYLHFAVQMLSSIKYLLKKAQHFPYIHLSIFTSTMLPQQWYPGWQLQQQAHKARSRLNEALAKVADTTGCYLVYHPELTPQDYPAFMMPGTQCYSTTGNLIFIADIESTIRRKDPDFMLPHQFQVLQNTLNCADK